VRDSGHDFLHEPESRPASNHPQRDGMNDGDFLRFQSLIESECGIYMSASKRELLVSRLQRRMRKLGIDSFSDYFTLVTSRERSEIAAMIDVVCTNETRFFRESAQFDYLREDLLPRLTREASQGKRPRVLRVWSAGCSTGEEPYSLAMLFADRLPVTAGWDVQIIATDISTRALEAARTGIWPFRKQLDVPHDYLRRFMLQSRDRTRFQASEEIRSLIRFAWLNLTDNPLPVDGPFDLIFCRNVLIYFQPVLRLRVMQQIASRLKKDGLLFLGHSETLHGADGSLHGVIPNVYQK
jgi:chemotaxis protein methyltransferase CheR